MALSSNVWSLVIAAGALAVSGLTLWLSFLRGGSVRMTRPTTIYFGPDPSTRVKIYLRTLLFATARRGRVIENMYLELERNNSLFNFPVWVFGESKIKRGSGLAVTDQGVAADHHFVMLRDGTSFAFIEGAYRIRIYAKLLHTDEPVLLLDQSLTVTTSLANALLEDRMGVYFDWLPVKNHYVAHSQAYDPTFTQSETVELLRAMQTRLRLDPEVDV